MKSPAFQFYPQDFLVGSADLTIDQVGAYIRLLCYQWAKGGLPNNPSQLASMCGCHGNATALPLHKFRICDDGLLRNDRLESVRKEQDEYRKKQAENAHKRWSNQKPECHGNATASVSHMPNACSSPSSSPSIKKEESIESKSIQRLFTDNWMLEFQKSFGVPYKFEGAKDGTAAVSLLKTGIPPENLIKIAKKAWSNQSLFWCKHALTLAGFSSKFNEIRGDIGELKSLSNSNLRPSYKEPQNGNQ